MDDMSRAGTDRPFDSVGGGAFRIHLARGILAVLLTASLSGCSLVVMAGKMILGDLKVQCAFRQSTGTDLTKQDKTILFVCSTPDSIKTDFPSLDLDLIDGVTRHVKVRGVKVVDPDEVTTWMDDQGNYWAGPEELADVFDTDYIVHFDLTRFTYKEENSPDLFRGRVDGRIVAYEVWDNEGERTVSEVFTHEFTTVHPSHHPVSMTSKSKRVFTKEFISRLTIQLGQLFYDHPASEQVH